METRVPAAASAPGDSSISPLRSRLTQISHVPGSCPAEVRDLLGSLSLEHVKYPPCPEKLASAFAAAHPVLTLEESTAVEALLNEQCRLNPREAVPEPIEQLLQPGSKRKDKDAGAANSDEMKLRDDLRIALAESRTASAPLDQWVRNNGDFVFPEEQLEFFDHLVGHDACRMDDQEVDVSYRTLRNLEELERIEAEGEPQRARIGSFLNGVHKVIDRKIKEFFR